jgi:hypothetical protein
MYRTIKDSKKDVFGRPIINENKNSLYGPDGKLKEIFRPKELPKINQLEKPMIKKKEKKDKFL